MATFITCSLIIIFIALTGTQKCYANILDSVSEYEVFVPTHLHAQRFRRGLSTKDNVPSGHLMQTSFIIKTPSQKFHVVLQLNRGLLHPDYAESYQRSDGSKYFVKNGENCYYHGMIYGKTESFVAMSTCNGIRGVIHDDDGEQYGVEPLDSDDFKGSDEHILFNMKNVRHERMECGVNDTSHEIHMPSMTHGHHHLVRRNTWTKDWKYISLALVIDKRAFERVKSNLTAASLRAKEIANYVDGVYKTIGIRVPLVMVEVWNVFDLIHVIPQAGKVLGRFQRYVYEVMRGKGYKQDNAQLLSGIDFEGGTIGMAAISVICAYDSAGINQDRTAAYIVSGTVAHEMGHNIGFGHNTGSCNCPTKPCVMNSVASSSLVKSFSSCSVTKLKQKIKDGATSCMSDVPSKFFGDPVCGNGFLEEGEECDCGTEEECKETGGDKCCDPKGCKLHSTAECAVGPCCVNCKFKSRGTSCRESLTECDLPEFCTGSSALCPANFYKQDGMSCKENEAYCFNGACRTYDEQCLAVWGEKANKAWDVCFKHINQRGDGYGNCGKDKRGEFIKCAPENVFCGKLICKDMVNSNPLIGHVTSILIKSYLTHGKWIGCRSPAVDSPKDLEDPSLIPDGLKCAEGKMCFNFTCSNITKLDFIQKCPYECQNGGICNNKGHCHCTPGYACPRCDIPGPGGSLDSGQGCFDIGASKGLSAVGKAMLVLFLLVLPVLVLAAYLTYRYRERIRAYINRPKEPGRRSRFSKLAANNREASSASPDKKPLKSPSGASNVAVVGGEKSGPSYTPKNQFGKGQKDIHISNPSYDKSTDPTVKFAGGKPPAKSPHRAPPPPPSKFGAERGPMDPTAPVLPNLKGTGKPLPPAKPAVFGKPAPGSAPAKPAKAPKVLPPVRAPPNKNNLPQWPPPQNQ